MRENEFVTADLHFGHKGILNVEPNPRPFASIEEMDRAIIENWNRKVPTRGAVVYVLGDVCFRSNDYVRPLLGQLNGTLRIVRGNHDRKNTQRVLEERAEWVKDYYESKTETGIKVVMFHYACLTWNKMHYGSWMLHGHSHNNLPPTRARRLDVGIDAHPSFEPFSYWEVEALMQGRKYIPVDHHQDRT